MRVAPSQQVATNSSSGKSPRGHQAGESGGSHHLGWFESTGSLAMSQMTLSIAFCSSSAPWRTFCPKGLRKVSKLA